MHTFLWNIITWNLFGCIKLQTPKDLTKKRYLRLPLELCASSFCWTTQLEINCIEITDAQSTNNDISFRTFMLNMNDAKERATSIIRYFPTLLNDRKFLERPKDQSRGIFRWLCKNRFSNALNTHIFIAWNPNIFEEWKLIENWFLSYCIY